MDLTTKLFWRAKTLEGCFYIFFLKGACSFIISRVLLSGFIRVCVTFFIIVDLNGHRVIGPHYAAISLLSNELKILPVDLSNIPVVLCLKIPLSGSLLVSCNKDTQLDRAFSTFVVLLPGPFLD